MHSHIVVWYGENRTCSTHPFDGQHTIIEQQTDKHARPDKLICRERRKHLGNNLAFFCNLAQYALTVTIEAIKLDEIPQLVVVGLGVRVEHHFGRRLVHHIVAKVEQDHVAVEDSIAIL